MTPAEAKAALNLPRIEGARSIEVGGKTISVVWLRRLACQDTSAVLPTPATQAVQSAVAAPPLPPRRDPVISTVNRSVFDRPDAELVEHNIIKEHTKFEAGASPIKLPEFTKQNGEHIKSYLINYIDRSGKFHCEKVAAKGIVTAITLFYITYSETAIISVICVL